MEKTKESKPQQVQQPDVKITKTVKATTMGSVGSTVYKPIPHFRSGCKKC